MPVTTRDRILAATRTLYLRHGEEGVTMRRVAEAASLTPTALYRHFENRSALIAEVITEGFRMLGSHLHRALKGSSPEARLRLTAEAYLDFALAQPAIYRAVFFGGPPIGTPGFGTDFPDPRTEVRDARQAATFRFLVDRVEECVGSGFLMPEDPDELALAIWAHLHGLASLYLAGAMGDDEDACRAACTRSMDLLFLGIAGRAGQD